MLKIQRWRCDVSIVASVYGFHFTRPRLLTLTHPPPKEKKKKVHSACQSKSYTIRENIKKAPELSAITEKLTLQRYTFPKVCQTRNEISWIFWSHCVCFTLEGSSICGLANKLLSPGRGPTRCSSWLGHKSDSWKVDDEMWHRENSGE